MSLRSCCLLVCLLTPSVSFAQGLFGEGLIQPTNPCFNDFISPMTNPVFFEDPRNLTEARLIFLNHSVPNSLGGGDVQLYALQLRASLTENLSFIATKDGFAVSDNPLVDDGWADVAAGLKYNLIQDPYSQMLLSAGAVYEMPIGATRTRQGNGDGEFNIFATGGVEVIDNVHYVTASGFRLPVDTNAESQVWYWSNHLDYQIGGTGLYLLGETNWYHWMKSGSAFPAPVEGGDLFNLGSAGVAGNDIVTGALGVKYKPADNMEIGFAWEIPLTDRKDILQDRLTVDWIIRY
ncbi:MAG: hypothetical protein KDA93_00450 [Planctomycetaceae bacterium]|nr:hypothetical protein [Planctomycetaceae bacterium]